MDLSAKLNRKEHGGKLSHSQAWMSVFSLRIKKVTFKRLNSSRP